MVMTASIKPRAAPPLGHRGRVPKLVVRHPHYRESNTLLKLPALDKGDTTDYNAALVICGIISDNSWNSGWFARASDGSNVCERGAPLEAAGGVVFYFVKDRDYKYPVYLSWDQWRLPSDTDLPVPYLHLPIDDPPLTLRNGGYIEDVKGRDASCRLSGIVDGCDQVHLVPATEREWWDLNMSERSDLRIESALNGMLLRTGLG